MFPYDIIIFTLSLLPIFVKEQEAAEASQRHFEEEMEKKRSFEENAQRRREERAQREEAKIAAQIEVRMQLFQVY